MYNGKRFCPVFPEHYWLHKSITVENRLTGLRSHNQLYPVRFITIDFLKINSITVLPSPPVISFS